MNGARWVVALVALVLVGAACGDSSTTAGSTTTSISVTPSSDAPGSEDLPPVEPLDLVDLYGDELADLGLVLTDRGGLIDRRDGRYEQSADGQHLALYVEPSGEYSEQQYVDGILTVTALFADDIFDRWTALESFDVCQEPPTEFDDRPEPVPATQIEMDRAQAGAIDWTTADLSTVLRAANSDPAGLRLVVTDVVRDTDAYDAALLSARRS